MATFQYNFLLENSWWAGFGWWAVICWPLVWRARCRFPSSGPRCLTQTPAKLSFFCSLHDCQRDFSNTYDITSFICLVSLVPTSYCPYLQRGPICWLRVGFACCPAQARLQNHTSYSELTLLDFHHGPTAPPFPVFQIWPKL